MLLVRPGCGPEESSPLVTVNEVRKDFIHLQQIAQASIESQPTSIKLNTKHLKNGRRRYFSH